MLNESNLRVIAILLIFFLFIVDIDVKWVYLIQSLLTIILTCFALLCSSSMMHLTIIFFIQVGTTTLIRITGISCALAYASHAFAVYGCLIKYQLLQFAW